MQLKDQRMKYTS